ncbi:MAG: amidohydrolase family protein, partial [Acidimicrobiales bacterium]
EVRDKAPGWDFSAPRGGNFQFAGVPIPEPEWVADRTKLFEADRFAEAAASNYDVASHFSAMDAEGIDLAVLFPSRGLLVPGVIDVDPSLIMLAAKAYNDWLADFCREGSQRLFGIGMLDLRDIDAARAEAIRCVEELGFVGLFLRPNVVEGKPLFDPKYEPLWATIADLDVPVCFHEGAKVRVPQVGPMELGNRWAFWHVCTHPHAQQIAMVALVMGGVLERHPSLRCAFLECGAGWLPYWMWRMDEHAEPRLWRYQSVGDVADLSLTPSEYVRRQCFVSIESDEEPGRHAVEALGGTNIVWASDYPHIDSTFPGAVDAFLGLGGISKEEKRCILSDNPAAMFGPQVRQALQDLPAGRSNGIRPTGATE